MKYNFDEVINRAGTSAEKVDGMKEIWGRTDLIPLWVADMDFATPPYVINAIRKRCEHPILGYTAKPESYYRAITDWVKRRYGMEIETKHLNYVPGIVPGLGMALNCFTRPEEKVMIMPPVYHPFAWLVKRNNRRLVECPLQLTDGHYRMDLEAFRRNIEGVRVFILCNPHNPGGVVWTEEELNAVADICAEHHVIVFSDEIHADLTLPPYRHRPFAMISERAKNNSVTFMAPSKAFNMPGMAASHTIIYNDSLRRQFRTYLDAGELDMGHVLAYPAVEAAYTQGEDAYVRYSISCGKELPQAPPRCRTQGRDMRTAHRPRDLERHVGGWLHAAERRFPALGAGAGDEATPNSLRRFGFLISTHAGTPESVPVLFLSI